MEPKWWKKYPREVKKAYGREIHSFRTRYEIHADYNVGTRTYRIPIQDIFLAPYRFRLKPNQRSKSWSLNEKIANEKHGWRNDLYEMIKKDGWYYIKPMRGTMSELRYS
jgi:hypothetical protein